MVYLGIIASVVLFICLSTMVESGRVRWFLVGLWCIPLICMVFFTNKRYEINVYNIAITFVMVFICAKSLIGVRMWNIKSRNDRFLFRIIILIITFALMFYSVRPLIYSCIYDSQVLVKNNINKVFELLTVVSVFLVCIPISTMVITFIDCLFCRETDLVLIKCKSSIWNKLGINGLWKGYFLMGINNGVVYHFKMTARTYFMIKSEKYIVLRIKQGWLGGLYVMENPCPQNLNKVKRRDKRFIKTWFRIIIIILVIITVHTIYIKILR